MLLKYINLIIKLCSLGLVIAAGGIWTGATPEIRPRYTDEQTLVGGAVWSQIVIPIGLLISTISDQHLDPFINAYFLLSGIVLLCITGVLLVRDECKSLILRRELEPQPAPSLLPIPIPEPFDRIYFCIGALCLAACLFKICELIILFL